MNIVQNTEQKTQKEKNKTQSTPKKKKILLLLVLSSQRNSKIVIMNSKLNVLVCLGHILSSG